MATLNRFPPDNCHYYANSGRVVPAAEIPVGYKPDPPDPSWPQLAHLKRRLAEAIAWYERLRAEGYDGMPAHMRRGDPFNWYVALATAYARVREMKGLVEGQHEALVRRRIARSPTMFETPE